MSSQLQESGGRVVARNFAALGAGEAVARLIAFGATVYVARALGAEMYGIIGFATAVLLYLSRVADYGIELSGARDIARDPSQLDHITSSVLTVRFLIATALIASTSVVALLVLPQPDGLILAVYSVALLAVGAGTRWIYVGMERARSVGLARVVGEITMALLVLLLVRGPGHVVRVPIAQAVGDVLAATLLFGWLRSRGHRLGFTLDWTAARPLFKRATPLVLSALLGLVIYNSDLIFLRFFRGTAEVGHYAAAYAMISFLVNLGLSYRMSLLPTLTRLAATPHKQQALYQGAMAHVFAVAFPIGLGGFLLAPQIVELVFGSGYHPAGRALEVLIWSVPLCLLRDVPSAALLANAREDQFFRLTAWGAGLNLMLNLILIPRYGMLGAAAATVATETARLFIALAYVRAHGFQLRDYSLFVRVGVAAVAMTALLFLVRPAVFWVTLPIGVVGYAAALLAVGAIRLRRGEFPALNV